MVVEQVKNLIRKKRRKLFKNISGIFRLGFLMEYQNIHLLTYFQTF